MERGARRKAERKGKERRWKRKSVVPAHLTYFNYWRCRLTVVTTTLPWTGEDWTVPV